MTLEEYMALVEKIPGSGMSMASSDAIDTSKNLPVTSKKRKKTARDRAMKKAIPIANERYKKKNGQFRAGRSQADVMKLANKLADKMMK